MKMKMKMKIGIAFSVAILLSGLGIVTVAQIVNPPDLDKTPEQSLGAVVTNITFNELDSNNVRMVWTVDVLLGGISSLIKDEKFPAPRRFQVNVNLPHISEFPLIFFSMEINDVIAAAIRIQAQEFGIYLAENSILIPAWDVK